MLPGLKHVLKVRRPGADLPEDPTLGERLRHRRSELGLRRIDVAQMLDVDEKTLMWWERDERPPKVHQYPAIIRYLKGEPWPETATLGEKLLAQRRRHGLSTKRAAEIVGVDEGTFGRWESGEWNPQRRSLPRIASFLDWVY